MHRRAVLGLAGAVAVAGCSEFLSDEPAPLDIGERATFGDGVDVTATDALTASEMRLTAGTPPESRTDSFAAPDGEQFALFELTADNAAQTDRPGPQFNIANYDVLTASDRTVRARGINDIRVFGSGQGGHLPADHDEGVGYDSISVADSTLPAYRQSVSGGRPLLETGKSIGGWVYGLIDGDATPELKVRFAGDSALWASA
jgi:hypothetical protein